MRKIITHIIPVFIALTMAMPVVSQNAKVKSRLDTTSILVGSQTNVRLSVECDENTKVLWPEIGDTLRIEIEVLEKSPVDTIALDNDRVSYKQVLKITSFDSGYYAVPPFRFVIDPDGIQQELETMAHLLEVHTIQVDTTQAFKDIAPIHEVPISFVEVVPWLLIGIAVVALIIFINILFKRRKSNEGQITVRRKPQIPPYKQALDDLDALKEKQLWQNGDLKGYYQGITDIFRFYLEQEFGVNAVEMTTSDILEQTAPHEHLNIFALQIHMLFTESDMVKFAKSKPGPDDHENIWSNAKQIIQETNTHKNEKKIIDTDVLSVENNAGEEVNDVQ